MVELAGGLVPLAEVDAVVPGDGADLFGETARRGWRGWRCGVRRGVRRGIRNVRRRPRAAETVHQCVPGFAAERQGQAGSGAVRVDGQLQSAEAEALVDHESFPRARCGV